MADAIDAAVKATEGAPPQPLSFRVRVGTGREVGLVVPADLRPGELVDLVAFLTAQLPGRLTAKPAPRSRLLVPTPGHIPRA
jgi:hypothetical protein